MSRRFIPEVPLGEASPGLRAVLQSLRLAAHSLLFGHPNTMGRAVTFQDLVDLGLVSEAKAREQASKRPIG